MIRQIITNSILAITMLLAGKTTAQSLPDPIRFYPLDYARAEEVARGFTGTIHGSLSGITDRFDAPYCAAKFNDGVYISTPSFFQDAPCPNGFTISFWTYIDEDYPKKAGIKPWDTSDLLYKAFYANQGDQTLLGFSRRNDRAIVERYTKNASKQNKNWGLWLWDPINFTRTQGWYQIVLSYQKNMMTTYMFYPNGRMEYSLHYMAVQDLTSATDWGIGNNIGKSFKYLDDVKVFDQPLTKEQVRLMYARESMPDGMYKISIQANDSQLIHTYANGTDIYAPLELYPDLPEFTAQYRWVLEKVPNKVNVYRVRMAYHQLYMHLANDSSAASTRVELHPYDATQAEAYEWRIDPNGGSGYFYIRSNKDRSLFLHTAGHQSSSSARLEILDYRPDYSTVYNWRFHLLKTKPELEKKEFNSQNTYLLVSEANPALGLMPQTPFSTLSSPLLRDRSPYVSYLPFYKMEKDIDDSYRLSNATYTDKWMSTQNRGTRDGAYAELNAYSGGYATSYLFVVDKPNPLGRKVELKLALNQSTSVYTGDAPTQGRAVIKNITDGPRNNHLWQAFASNGTPRTNKQIYDLQPGVYRIYANSNSTMFLKTADYSWAPSTQVQVGNYDDNRSTSFSWYVDYERDDNGNPVKDGSYVIRLLGTDNLFLHPVGHATTSSTLAETYQIDRDHICTYKWYVRPARDGSGSYYIQNAANPDQFLHLVNHQAAQNRQVELYPFIPDFANAYKWQFVKIDMPNPGIQGLYKVALAKDNTRYMHVGGRSAAEGARLEIFEYLSDFNIWYLWSFDRKSDGTYQIGRSIEPFLIHPIANSYTASTQMELWSYNSDYSYNYKWIIEPGSTPNSYRFRLVANPSLYLHTVGHSSSSSTRLELYPFVPEYANSYEWILQKQ